MSDFTQEFHKVVKNKEVTPTNDTSPAAPEAPAEKVNHAGTEMFNNVAKPEAPAEPTLADATPEGKVPEPPPEVKEVPIKIGNQVFKSVEEAIAYANDLEMATIQQEAYELGKKAVAEKNAPAEPIKTVEDEIEEELFVDPKKALAKYKEAILKEIKTDIQKEKTAEQKAKEQAELRAKTWNDFYNKNQDLSKNKDLVEFVMNKNPEILSMNADKALELLASKTRAYIASVRESHLPSKELPSAPVISPAGGNPATTTPAQTTEKAIDFISQLNKLKKTKA